jgi:predicted acyltransferase
MPLDSSPGALETAVAPAVRTKSASRLISLDALRGFDMLWICGLDLIFRYLGKHFDVAWLKWMGAQMDHPKWEGFTLYDMIFPLFIFVSGVTIPFALLTKLEKGESKAALHLKVVRRMLLLIALGIIYNGGLTASSLHSIRYGSVLGTIGIGYGFAAIIAMNCRLRGQVIWLLAILLGYWAALTLFPVPGVGAGVITPEGCVCAWVDQHCMPGVLGRKTYEAVGILPSIAAIPSALFGVLAGHWLRGADRKPGRKWLGLLLGGMALTGLGWFWGLYLPIIKNIWTSSYVVLCAGWSCLLLSLFYGVIDVLGYRRWAFPFIVIGMNSITIYMASRLIDFKYIANFLCGGLIKFAPSLYQPLLLLTAVLLIKWLLLYFLYRRKIFLRL